MSNEVTGNQFKIIVKAKQALLDSTNIESSPDEMKVLNDFLFRCWQMGWLDRYKDTKDVIEVDIPYPRKELEKYGLTEWKDKHGQRWVMIERREHEKHIHD